MQTLDCHKTIPIPREVGICPYCESDLIAQPTAWEQLDDGTWCANESGIECTNQPDPDDEDAWDEWVQEHTDMPYVYWLPVDTKVLAWMRRQFRFDIQEGTDDAQTPRFDSPAGCY